MTYNFQQSMKHKKNLFRVFFSALTLFALLLTSCGGDAKERNAKDATSALIHQRTGIVGFGHISILGVLNKMNYQKIPKVNVLVGAQLKTWQKAFKLEGPMYFAVEGPFELDGTPETLFAVADITSTEDLKSVTSEMGYAMEKTGDIEYFQENDVTFGVRNKLFILISKKGDYDGKKEIEAAFKATEGDMSEGKTQEIIDTEGDIVLGFSLERLFETANTALNKVSGAKLDELKGLLADGYVSNNVKFENGKITITSKNMFSDELKNKLFFKDNNGNALVKKLGNGSAWMGIAANIDVKKMEKFMTDFSLSDALTNGLPSEAQMMMMMTAGAGKFSEMMTGQFGLVATGNPAAAMGMEFEMNAFLGVPASSPLRSQFDMMSFGQPKQGNAVIMESVAIEPKSDGYYVYSLKNKGQGKLQIPSYASNFGKNTFSMFIAFDKMDMKSLELEDEMKVLEIMESFTVDVTKDGSTMVLTSKNKSSNILKQIGEFYYKTLEEKIGAI